MTQHLYSRLTAGPAEQGQSICVTDCVLGQYVYVPTRKEGYGKFNHNDL